MKIYCCFSKNKGDFSAKNNYDYFFLLFKHQVISFFCRLELKLVIESQGAPYVLNCLIVKD